MRLSFLPLLLIWSLWPSTGSPAETELIRDPHFQNGFTLLQAKPGQRVPYGTLTGLNPAAEPVWDLAQWSSRFPLESTHSNHSFGNLAWTNEGKAVRVGKPGTPEADLALRVNAHREYELRARQMKDPWTHLLVQQNLENPPALPELAACHFQLEAKLNHSRLHRTEDYSPDRHAAQFLVYLTIANRNPRSPGFGQYLWFGIPVYDDRHAVVPAYQAEDFGDTKMFIYTVASDAFSARSSHDGEWIKLDRDILPLIHNGLNDSWAKGFLPGSRHPADYQITGIFIGWEVPGLFDVEAQIRNLSVKAISRPKTAVVDFVTEHPELLLTSSQAWGQLGWNTAAHADGQAGEILRIGNQSYTNGLGHHAHGTITLLLDGLYDRFDCEVGLHPCGGGGSVRFKVLVDGETRSETAPLRPADEPLRLDVDVGGAHELTLVSEDAGDGITCDMANWINPRLIRTSTGRLPAEPSVDIARFARVVTWDPTRSDGSRASRVEDFRAEDLFLETDLQRLPEGCYAPTLTTDNVCCLGLQWLNRRALKEVGLEFSHIDQMPPIDSVRVQGWFGESAWQGQWQTLPGELVTESNWLRFRIKPTTGLLLTQKLRWIFPADAPPAIRALSALTRSRWQDVTLRLEAETPGKSDIGKVTVWNGNLVSGEGNGHSLRENQPSPDTLEWDMTQPLLLKVRANRTSLFQSDRTVLQFQLPSGRFGVAVDDVLTNPAVYVPDHRLFITRDPAPVTLAEHRDRHREAQTIRQLVTRLPDQTLDQAMAKTHHAAQREGPVMLSLAANNSKYVLERNGTLRFQSATNVTTEWLATAGEMRPQFGLVSPNSLQRSLEGRWLPIPVTTTEASGVSYSQRTFVAPLGDSNGYPGSTDQPSVCVTEFLVTNSSPATAKAVLKLNFLDGKRQSIAASPSGRFDLGGTGLAATITTSNLGPLSMALGPHGIEVTGDLPPGTGGNLQIVLGDSRIDLESLSTQTSRLRHEVELYWNAVLKPAMQVQTPDPLLNDLIRSSQVRCLIAARSEAGGARIAPWIAGMSYGPLESEAHSIIRGMGFLGHRDFARRGLDYFIHRYHTNGYLTTGYTTFGTGWHLWTLGEHYRLYRDRDWLRQRQPDLVRAGNWILRQTAKTRRTGPGPQPPEEGLMPPGVLADWNSFAYHYAMNAYYCAALRELSGILEDLGDAESARFKSGAADLQRHTLRAYRWTQAQSPVLPLRNGTWIPHYPSQVHSPGKLAEFFPGQDAGRSWCYDVELGAHQLVPTGVLDPRDREVDRLLDHMEDVQFLADGWFDYPASMNHQDWFNLGGFSKVQPYYTRNAEIYALRDEVKPFLRSYFNSIASLLNPEILAFWEHFHHSGAWDKTHETGYFLHQTRLMLLNERDGELWLAPLMSTNWLADGESLTVERAPTLFGFVDYRIESQLKQDRIQVKIDPPSAVQTLPVVLRLPHPGGGRLQSVQVNGKPHRDFQPASGLVRFVSRGQPLRLTLQYDPPMK